jgi:predicted Rossmann fold nucleotide-binding protein DprA/Smf involved in DNA uptake
LIKNQVVALRPDDQFYPQGLHYYFGKNAPSAVFALGNIEILKARTVAIFCSIKCPGDLILKTYDLARIFRDHEITVIGGFHSPMEKECLSLLLRGKQPIILCQGLEATP